MSGRIVATMDEPALSQLSTTSCWRGHAVRRRPPAGLAFADLACPVDHHRRSATGGEAVYPRGRLLSSAPSSYETAVGAGQWSRSLDPPEPAQVAAANRDGTGWRITAADRSTVFGGPPRTTRARGCGHGGDRRSSVADECVAVLHAYGLRPTVLADCGVAGVHRLLASSTSWLRRCRLVVARHGGAWPVWWEYIPGHRCGRSRVEWDGAALEGSPPCSPCTHRVLRPYRRWVSTTVSEPPAPLLGSPVSSGGGSGAPGSPGGVAHDAVPPTASTIAWFHCFAGIAGDYGSRQPARCPVPIWTGPRSSGSPAVSRLASQREPRSTAGGCHLAVVGSATTSSCARTPTSSGWSKSAPRRVGPAS